MFFLTKKQKAVVENSESYEDSESIIPEEDNALEAVCQELKLNIESLTNENLELREDNRRLRKSYEQLLESTNGSTDCLKSSKGALSDFSHHMEELAYNLTNVHSAVINTDKNAEQGIKSLSLLDSSLEALQEAFDDIKKIHRRSHGGNKQLYYEFKHRIR